MGLRQKDTEGNKYIIEKDFVESLQEFGTSNSLKIAYHIDRSTFPLISNPLITTILGGLIFDSKQNPVTFAVEVYKTSKNKIILSDVKKISMDDYLDLNNLNQTLTLYGKSRKSKSYKKHSQ